MQRETWTGKLGFILASVGSAIGLGNIWLFSWRIGAYGGAAFLIPYLLFVFGIASFALMAEWAFGRSQQKGAIGAFEKVFKERNTPRLGQFIGIIPVTAVYAVFIFYAVVIGWIIKYFVLSIANAFPSMEISSFFGGFAGSPQSILWHALGVLLTMTIVYSGVQKGIEKANKIMMPLILLLLIILVIRSLTLQNAMEGLKYMIVPDWTKLGMTETWVMALGQAFFTLSLGGATMLVYGSYVREDMDIPSAAIQTVLYNFSASMLAALVIIPSVFAFHLDPKAGPALLFITLPNVFIKMPGGYLFSVLFFLAMIFASLSSSVSMLEPAVEGFMDKLNLSRKLSVTLLSLIAFLVGIPLDLNMSLFSRWTDIVTIYLLPFGAVVAVFVFFWIYGAPRARKAINKGAKKDLGIWFEYYGKYVVVCVALAVMIINIAFGGIG